MTAYGHAVDSRVSFGEHRLPARYDRPRRGSFLAAYFPSLVMLDETSFAKNPESRWTHKLCMNVTLESPKKPEVAALIAELDAYQDTLYPAEARYALDLDALALPSVLFAVARDSDGIPKECGAIVINDDYGELKRMYVRPEARGVGTAQQIIEFLESAARMLGCETVLLEMGPHSPQALAFYTKQGYARCGPHGEYPDHPLSVFMRKRIAP